MKDDIVRTLASQGSGAGTDESADDPVISLQDAVFGCGTALPVSLRRRSIELFKVWMTEVEHPKPD